MADAPNADVGMLKPVDATAGAATSGKAEAGAGANVTAVTAWPALALAAVVAVAAAAAASAAALLASVVPQQREGRRNTEREATHERHYAYSE